MKTRKAEQKETFLHEKKKLFFALRDSGDN